MTANREEQESTTGSFFTEPTRRVQRLRSAFLDIMPTVSIERARIEARVMRETENCKDLMLKVAGYNAYFTKLSKELQDSIIARTEHGL
ncbi:MAG: hypothetical protein JSW38_09995 [Dehalococcoidia bacterium]|nr:MAG: hypothetical protein JSW38_09995 [Dehalococcoidia bacterium]